MRDRDKFYVIGHRGVAGLVSENTLTGFELAWEIGLNAVELDVHLVEDELLVIHDTTLDRTTNGHGKLIDHTLAELRDLDAGSSQRIPLLEEVLAGAPDGALINVELKGRNTAEAVANRLPHYPNLEFLVSSFYHEQLATFRELDTNTAVAPLYHKWQDNIATTAQELNAQTINLNVKICNAKRMERLKEQGFQILVYTVNNVRTALRLKKYGANAVFSDYPDRLINKGL